MGTTEKREMKHKQNENLRYNKNKYVETTIITIIGIIKIKITITDITGQKRQHHDEHEKEKETIEYHEIMIKTKIA